jgi:2-methylcitrate dehydratase PrpD
VFAAAGAAGRALALGEDEMLSALGMAGIYTPVPAGHKYLSHEGLTPRRDIKQGWAWMCMTGTFAAVSAQKGLKMLQENNILDGDRGLWRMLGMDVFKEERITADLGERFQINKFQTKVISGCSVTHTAITSLRELVRDHGINPGDIDKIDVITAKGAGIGFDDQEPQGLVDRQFSMPYQVSASLFAGDPGPNWYLDEFARSPEVTNMMKRVWLSFDDECEQIFREQRIRVSKLSIVTKDGKRYETRADRDGEARTGEEIRKKFITTTSQVIDTDRANDIADTIENLEEVGRISELIDLLRIPA